jgi:hypothetical protein
VETLENHAAMAALDFIYDNVGQVHETLCRARAIRGGIGNHARSIGDIVGLLHR